MKEMAEEKIKAKIILREQTPKVPFIKSPETWGKENIELQKAVVDYLNSESTALGVAANQLELDGKRCMERFFVKKEKNPIRWTFFINPKLIESKGDIKTKREGCLTWPKEEVIADRHYKIKVSYYTIEGEYKEEWIVGRTAQIWQHELCHLDGIEEKLASKTKNEKQVEVAKPIMISGSARNLPCPCGSGIKAKKCKCRKYKLC